MEHRLQISPVLVVPLCDEIFLELAEELQVEKVVSCEGLLAHHGLHGLHVLPCGDKRELLVKTLSWQPILTDGVAGVQLVGHIGVILPGHSLTNGRLHQPGERGQHVDGRIDLSVVELPVHVYLALGNVASQVRDGMSDVIVGHRQDGDLSDRAVPALHPARPLVDGG